MGCESKIDNSFSTYSLFLDCYSEVYRKDRTKDWGVVFCAIREDVLACEEKDFLKDNECVWGSVQFANTHNLYTSSFHRPPRAPLEQMEQLEQSLTDIHTRFTRHHPNIIMAGDFNATDISWDSGTITSNSNSINATKLIGIVEQFGLTQHQMDISRPASNAVLDLVFSTNPNKVEVVPGMSDHLAVLISLDVCPKPYIKAPHKFHLYKRDNFDGLREDMSNMSCHVIPP